MVLLLYMQGLLVTRFNGIGFEIDKIITNDNLNGNGLKNMKLRAKEISGDLKIMSSKNEGTKIILTFPY